MSWSDALSWSWMTMEDRRDSPHRRLPWQGCSRSAPSSQAAVVARAEKIVRAAKRISNTDGACGFVTMAGLTLGVAAPPSGRREPPAEADRGAADVLQPLAQAGHRGRMASSLLKHASVHARAMRVLALPRRLRPRRRRRWPSVDRTGGTACAAGSLGGSFGSRRRRRTR